MTIDITPLAGACIIAACAMFTLVSWWHHRRHRAEAPPKQRPPISKGEAAAILSQQVTRTPLQLAMRRLEQELRNDPEYRHGWEANIAMAFVDQYNATERRTDEKGSEYMHRIGNAAAKAFIMQLTDDTAVADGLPGMAAVAAVHHEAAARTTMHGQRTTPIQHPTRP